MIDCENIVFTKVAESLRAEISGIFVSGENVAAPPSFPAATIVEMDNSTYERSIDSSFAENHAIVMYQAEAFSNKTSGRKAEAKKIMDEIDKTMIGLGFIRLSKSPMNNTDSSIYRMVARYRAVIGTDYLVFHK